VDSQTEKINIQIPNGIDYCKVIFPYEAQNDDELTIKEGDIVTLINKDCIDVGWWEGELNGRRGVFPDNFVKLLPPDFEKEGNRPKKPPPPSAPVIKQGAGTTERKHEIKKIPPERPETLPNRTEEKERPEREPKLDLPKPSVPAIPPKKPRPPKTNSLSRPGALPPRRPERPVGPLTHTRGDGAKIDLVGSSIPGMLDKDLSDRSNDIDLEGFDSVVSSTEKLSHPTTSRPKATGRRPPSQSLTSSSLSSPDIFDSPSPEEDKERTLDASKKTSKTVTISQVSEACGLPSSLPPMSLIPPCLSLPSSCWALTLKKSSSFSFLSQPSIAKGVLNLQAMPLTSLQLPSCLDQNSLSLAPAISSLSFALSTSGSPPGGPLLVWLHPLSHSPSQPQESSPLSPPLPILQPKQIERNAMDGRLNMVRVAKPLKLIYISRVIPAKTPVTFPEEINKLILRFTQTWKYWQ
uniref:SH3 domain-containing protein n=1 Tax=Capra hircus TaxID=9925 RepID=A0A452DP22_CAPHI